MIKLNILFNLSKIKHAIDKRFQESNPPVVTFGVVGLINFPLFYIIWLYATPLEYSNFLMRLIAAIFCLFLILKKQWPKKLQTFLPLFWYIAITYCLATFGTFMFLKNHGSSTWLTNAMLGLFWLMLVTDWLSFMIILPLGILLGLAIYILNGGTIYFNGSLLGTFSNYAAAIIVAAIFAHDKEKIQIAKLQVIKTIGASIAHELRTPIRTISLLASTIKDYIPSLEKTYQIAQQNNLAVPLEESDYQELVTTCDEIEAETLESFTVINMLLMNVNQTISTKDFKTCSINACIEEAIRRYPFDLEEPELVHWQSRSEADFTFTGHQLLVVHILFNLMKNAFYQIKAAGKGEIYLWTEQDKKYNRLHFKDTAKGISAKVLPRIFDRFYTASQHGTGIGLAFCKLVMQSFDGDITCQSVEGEYAEFIMTFPKVT